MWMSHAINITAWLYQLPDLLCLCELMYGKRPHRAPLRLRSQAFITLPSSKMEAKGPPRFILDASPSRCRDCFKVSLLSGVAGYTTYIAFGYSRCPRFTGVVATKGGGAVENRWEDQAPVITDVVTTAAVFALMVLAVTFPPTSATPGRSMAAVTVVAAVLPPPPS